MLERRRRRWELLLLWLDAMRADDSDVVSVSVGLVGARVRCIVLFIVTGGSAHETIAPTAVVLNVDIVNGLDIGRVLVWRRVHPEEESCVTPRY